MSCCPSCRNASASTGHTSRSTTQGFDIEVLRGAGDSLPGVKALQTEASVIGIYKGMPQYMDTIRYLEERGFDITGLYPVSRDSALRLVEFDCVMINRVLAGAPA